MEEKEKTYSEIQEGVQFSIKLRSSDKKRRQRKHDKNIIDKCGEQHILFCRYTRINRKLKHKESTVR